ncbi:hypothetical protein CWR48_13900 [Oceanobacillus arenosus]|uniref:Uncharacterized protein n=1 Tax=Oceanobacillus arenosus TaxID=1229153 RepID=A0A3D8PNC7_9BACI|nr:ERF family protein [Oceanobacillus arenosus]RDW17606.1 hypothetical protein CWR48_13900 [Oceanobacillus arenosus]
MKTSESITKISAALAKAWGDINNPKHNKNVKVKTKNGGQYTFDYTDLGGIFDEVKPAFKENGITIIQGAYTEDVNGKTILYVDTMFLHSSGEWIKSNPLKMTASQSIQDMGGQITYLKRYSLSAMLGVATEKDDDANGSLGNDFQENGPPPEGAITPQQVGMIKSKSHQYAKARNQTLDKVYEVLNITDITQLTEEQAQTIIKQLEMWLDGIKKEQGAV